MVMNKMLQIEVAYASLTNQCIIKLEMEAESTIEMAIKRSGMLMKFPGIDLAKQKIGVFSKPRKLTDKVHDGDRIEIYRPLIIEPKEARRIKARSVRKKSA